MVVYKDLFRNANSLIGTGWYHDKVFEVETLMKGSKNTYKHKFSYDSSLFKNALLKAKVSSADINHSFGSGNSATFRSENFEKNSLIVTLPKVFDNGGLSLVLNKKDSNSPYIADVGCDYLLSELSHEKNDLQSHLSFSVSLPVDDVMVKASSLSPMAEGVFGKSERTADYTISMSNLFTLNKKFHFGGEVSNSNFKLNQSKVSMSCSYQNKGLTLGSKSLYDFASRKTVVYGALSFIFDKQFTYPAVSISELAADASYGINDQKLKANVAVKKNFNSDVSMKVAFDNDFTTKFAVQSKFPSQSMTVSAGAGLNPSKAPQFGLSIQLS